MTALGEFRHFWDAAVLLGGDVANLGTDAAPVATTPGMTRVVGPAFFLPGATGNSLVVGGSTGAQASNHLTVVFKWTHVGGQTLTDILSDRNPAISAGKCIIRHGATDATLQVNWFGITEALETETVNHGVAVGETAVTRIRRLNYVVGAGEGEQGGTWEVIVDKLVNGVWVQQHATGNQTHDAPYINGQDFQIGGGPNSYGRSIIHWMRSHNAPTENANLWLDVRPEGVSRTATSFTAGTGQTITINRTTTGQIVHVVPVGRVAYANNDATVSTNRWEMAVATSLGATTHAVLAWCGAVGNPGEGLAAHLASTGTNFRMTRSLTADQNTWARVEDQDTDVATTIGTPHTPAAPAVNYYEMILDRTADLLKHVEVTAAGVTVVRSITAATIDAVTYVNPWRSLQGVHGTVEMVAYDEPVVAPTTAQITARGVAFLNRATETFPGDARISFSADNVAEVVT